MKTQNWMLFATSLLCFTACRDILGIDDGSSEVVQCTKDRDCAAFGGGKCHAHRCIDSSAFGQAAGSALLGIDAGSIAGGGMGAASTFSGGLPPSSPNLMNGNSGGSSASMAILSSVALGGSGGFGGEPSGHAKGGVASVTDSSTNSALGGSSNRTPEMGGSTDDGKVDCLRGEHRCVQDPRVKRIVVWETCGEKGKWGDPVPCEQYCREDSGCGKASSCVGLGNCAENYSCCNSLPLPGGEYFRSPIEDEPNASCQAENDCKASISPFLLDTFEVTVGRFSAFVENYPFNLPASGAGANPNDSNAPGWDSRWLENVDMVPTNKAQLLETMSTCGGNESDQSADNLPVSCVNWYVAFAFCIWDGGRLPTEAEWNYAGAGGDENRVYPWSAPWYDDGINAEHARYDAASPQSVGSANAGESRWGQFDLAGNVAEWTADAYQYDYGYPAINCVDCVDSRWDLPARVTRGGSFQFDSDSVKVRHRGTAGAQHQSPRIGFRCVRNH